MYVCMCNCIIFIVDKTIRWTVVVRVTRKTGWILGGYVLFLSVVHEMGALRVYVWCVCVTGSLFR